MTDTTYRTEPLPPAEEPPASPPPPRRRRRPRAGLVAVALAGALVGGGAGAAVTTVLDEPSTPAASAPVTPARNTVADAPSSNVTQVAAQVLPSVVSIAVRGPQGAGVGTGVIIDRAGHVLTNNHVVAAAAGGGSITIRLSDGRSRSATIVGRDPVSDLAVLKVSNPAGLTPAALGRSSGLAVGDPVVAFGSPLGLSGTVTSGIVSALDRPVRTGGAQESGADTTSTVLDAIQTDAAINPGNSGGPLVNMRGEVVGINSAIATLGGSAGESGSIGLGFSIPIDQARPIADELIKNGKARHAYLAVTVPQSDNQTGDGVPLASVTPGGAAAKAGLRAGDLVTAIGDRPVTTGDALIAAVRAHRPGDEVQIRYVRGGETRTATVTLGTAPY
jgi:putative serine protease PepD